jgi:hypothetical protein
MAPHLCPLAELENQPRPTLGKSKITIEGGVCGAVMAVMATRTVPITCAAAITARCRPPPSAASGSQTGGQRRQASSHTGQQQATITAGH